MRTLFGVGTPRSLQGRLAAVVPLLVAPWTHVVGFWRDCTTPSADHSSVFAPHRTTFRHRVTMSPLTTGC